MSAPPARDGDKPHFHGHRERLKKRFHDGGGAALADYELLELILFQSLPRRDTKPIAKALLTRFGCFSEVLARTARRTRARSPASATRSSIISSWCRPPPSASPAIPCASARSSARGRRSSTTARAAMAYETIEQFRVLFLDKKNMLIADEVQQTGTVDHTPVYPREVVKRALELSATAIILVHNHPSGDPTPSTADIQMTKQVVDIAKPLGIAVHDHIIIGKRGHVSLKGLQLM